MTNLACQKAVRLAGAILVAPVIAVVFSATAASASYQFDSSFGTTNGFTRTTDPEVQVTYSTVKLSNGKLVVGAMNFDTGDVEVSQYTSAGLIDTSFSGPDGKFSVTLPGIGTTAAETVNVGVQSSGKIVVAGSFYDTTTGYNDLYAMRLDSTGVIDPTFGTAGQTLVHSPLGVMSGKAMAIGSDDSIVLVGNINGATQRMLVTKFDADGTLDASFGLGGGVETVIDNGSDANDVVIQSDGKIVVTGYAIASKKYQVVVRYLTTGALDTSFGVGGIAAVDFGVQDNEGSQIRLASDGNIYVGGVIYSSDKNVYINRLNPSGSMDTTYNGGGVRVFNNSGNEEVRYFELLSDGSTIMFVVSENDWLIVKFDASGSNDFSFNDGDYRIWISVPDDNPLPTAGFLLSGGEIVVVGHTQQGGADIILARFMDPTAVTTTTTTTTTVASTTTTTSAHHSTTTVAVPESTLPPTGARAGTTFGWIFALLSVGLGLVVVRRRTT